MNSAKTASITQRITCPEIERLTTALADQFAQSADLEQQIKENLEGLGYGV